MVMVSSGSPCRWDELAPSQGSQLPPELHAGDPSGVSFPARSFPSTQAPRLSEHSAAPLQV